MNRRAWLLTGLIFALTAVGLVMVGNASMVDAARDFGDKLYYLKSQSLWCVIGIIGFIIASRFPLSFLEK